MNQQFNSWQSTGFAPLLEKYRSLLFGKGEFFSVRENGVEKTLQIVGVDDQGALLVEENKLQRSLVSGLEWIIRS